MNATLPDYLRYLATNHPEVCNIVIKALDMEKADKESGAVGFDKFDTHLFSEKSLREIYTLYLHLCRNDKKLARRFGGRWDNYIDEVTDVVHGGAMPADEYLGFDGRNLMEDFCAFLRKRDKALSEDLISAYTGYYAS